MIGLVFGLEKNVCEYILIYTDSEGFFFGGFAHGLPGVGGYGRGGGGGDCNMDPGLGQKCVPSLKNTTDFLVHYKQRKGQEVVG